MFGLAKGTFFPTCRMILLKSEVSTLFFKLLVETFFMSRKMSRISETPKIAIVPNPLPFGTHFMLSLAKVKFSQTCKMIVVKSEVTPHNF